MSNKANNNRENWLIKKFKSQNPAQLTKGTPGVADEKQKQALKEKLAKKLEEALQSNRSLES